MFKQFKAKPVIIEAVQWDGSIEGGREIASVVGCTFYENTAIMTLPNESRAYPGDWVVKNALGKFEVMSEDKFKSNYEKADKPKEVKPTK